MKCILIVNLSQANLTKHLRDLKLKIAACLTSNNELWLFSFHYYSRVNLGLSGINILWVLESNKMDDSDGSQRVKY